MYTKINVEWWKRRHTPEVLAIEQLNHGENAEDEKYFIELLEDIVGCVAERKADGAVLGFMMYELFDTKLDILHFEVHPDWRGCEIEAQMFDNLVHKCQSNKKRVRTLITWVVNEKDYDLQVFLREKGAKCVQVRRNFFAKTGESGYLFEFQVPKAPIEASELQL